MNTSLPAPPWEEPPPYIGRVSPNVFEPLIGVFYGLAMLGALTRLGIQLKTHRRLQVDDFFLIVACTSLTASTILSYIKVRDLYWSQALNYDSAVSLLSMEEHTEIAAHINAYQLLYNSYASFLWTTIFAVKFAYLTFFRRLVDRLRPLVIYWRFIVGLSAVSFPVCVVSIYVSCKEKRQENAYCLQPVYFNLALGLATLDAVLDITTDLMIIGIPLYLLWSVRIQPRQKFILGIFLSLNLFMTFAAAVRASGIRYHGTFDVVWLFLWHHIEACVAVIMISLTAFRSFYVSSRNARARREPANKAWYSGTVAAMRRKRILNQRDEESVPGLPTIPSATLTGMRTFIQGERRTGTDLESTYSIVTGDEEPEQWLLHERPAKQEWGPLRESIS